MKKYLNEMNFVKGIALVLILCMSFCLMSCSGSGIKNIDKDESVAEKSSVPTATEKANAGSDEVNDDNSADKTDDNEQGNTITNTDDVPKGDITLTVPLDVYPTESQKKPIEQWVANFEKMYPDVNVEIDFSDRSNWSARMSAKDIGDVFWVSDGDVYNYGVKRNVLMPLDSFVEKYSQDSKFGLNVSDVYSSFYSLGKAEGSLYMVATHCGQTVFTYNKGLLEQAGLPMPSNDWTWSDFKEYISKLTVTGADGSLTQVGAAMRLCMSYDSSAYVPFYSGFGGEWSNVMRKQVKLASDDYVVKGVKELVNVLENKWVYPLNSEGIGFDYMSSDYRTAFSCINSENIYATAGFIQLGDISGLSTIARVYDSLGIDWDIATFPLFDAPATPCGTYGFGVFQYTDNPIMAAALALSSFTQNGQRALNSGGGVPVLHSLSREDFWRPAEFADKNLDAFVANTDSYITAQVNCLLPGDVADIVIYGMKELFKDLYSGNLSVEDRLTRIETSANEKWATIR